jgi:hypothetical protein
VQRGVSRETGRVARRVGAPQLFERALGVLPAEQIDRQLAEDPAEGAVVEVVGQRAEHGRGDLGVPAVVGHPGGEQVPPVDALDAPADDQWPGPLDHLEIGAGAQDRAEETDRGQVSLADLAQADGDPQPAGRHAGLIGVGHDRRIAQGGGLDRELVGEVGADQQTLRGRQVRRPGHPMPDQAEVVQEDAFQIAVPPLELRDGPAEQVGRFGGGQVGDAVDQGVRPGPHHRRVLTGHEQLDDHPAGIGQQGQALPGDRREADHRVFRRVGRGHRGRGHAVATGAVVRSAETVLEAITRPFGRRSRGTCGRALRGCGRQSRRGMVAALGVAGYSRVRRCRPAGCGAAHPPQIAGRPYRCRSSSSRARASS